jgi:lysophospholipase L1-like esterase
MADALARQLNQGIARAVAERPAARLVDLHAALGPDDLEDDVHPNATGHDRIARAFHAALRAIVRKDEETG